MKAKNGFIFLCYKYVLRQTHLNKRLQGQRGTDPSMWGLADMKPQVPAVTLGKDTWTAKTGTKSGTMGYTPARPNPSYNSGPRRHLGASIQ